MGPEVNKFEQVSSDGHQVPLARGPCTVNSYVWREQGLWGSLYNEVKCQGRLGSGNGETLYSKVHFIMGNVHPEQNDRQTPVKHYLPATSLGGGNCSKIPCVSTN